MGILTPSRRSTLGRGGEGGLRGKREGGREEEEARKSKGRKEGRREGGKEGRKEVGIEGESKERSREGRSDGQLLKYGEHTTASVPGKRNNSLCTRRGTTVCVHRHNYSL